MTCRRKSYRKEGEYTKPIESWGDDGNDCDSFEPDRRRGSYLC